MRVVLAFDIADDKRRSEVVKIVLARLVRVQESVFEGELDEASFLRLRSDCEGVIEHSEDKLRYWQVCRACARRTVAVGAEPVLVAPPSAVKVIG